MLVEGKMGDLSKIYINDAKNFQLNGQFDLAILYLEQAQQYDCSNEHYVEIQKLLCFNYRKMEDFDMALLHINYAINFLLKQELTASKEYAICLMNKGVVFEERHEYTKALSCYTPALEILKKLCNSIPDEFGLIINALFTIGALYYKQKDFINAEKFLREAIPYFTENKDTDRRYLAIMNTLAEIRDL